MIMLQQLVVYLGRMKEIKYSNGIKYYCNYFHAINLKDR